jgi:hypothetical protein
MLKCSNFRRPGGRRAAAGGVSQAKTTLFTWRSYHLKRSFQWYTVLEQFNFGKAQTINTAQFQREHLAEPRALF